MKNFLKILFNPAIWFLNYPVSKKWDKLLNEVLDSPNLHIKQEGPYTVSINGLKVWVSNYPYAYGTPYLIHASPRRTTILKLKKMMDKLEKSRKDQSLNDFIQDYKTRRP